MSSSNKLLKQYTLASRSTDRGWMFGYPTATIDRFSPGVEEIYLPPAVSLEGELRVEVDLNNSCESVSQVGSRVSRLKSRLLEQCVELEPGQIGLDLRLRAPQNWAHSITNHLPIALVIKDLLQASGKQLVVIFPAGLSTKILDIFQLSGFICLSTSAPVRGFICSFSLEPWISIRGERCEIVKSGLKGTELIERIESCEVDEDRIFLSRRDKRAITNEAQIAEYLDGLGFKTIYPEDYSPIEQLAYIVKAKEIVSVHGAALGPMIVRSAFEHAGSYKLIEIFSPAHVTNVWRMIAWQQGAQWAAVRGRVWPSLVGDKANFVSNMSNFEVSLDSVKSALTFLDMGQK